MLPDSIHLASPSFQGCCGAGQGSQSQLYIWRMAAKAPGEGAHLQRSMGPQGERDSQVPKMLSWEEVKLLTPKRRELELKKSFRLISH